MSMFFKRRTDGFYMLNGCNDLDVPFACLTALGCFVAAVNGDRYKT